MLQRIFWCLWFNVGCRIYRVVRGFSDRWSYLYIFEVYIFYIFISLYFLQLHDLHEKPIFHAEIKICCYLYNLAT